jgi:hypothetical protein
MGPSVPFFHIARPMLLAMTEYDDPSFFHGHIDELFFLHQGFIGKFVGSGDEISL